MYVLMSTPSCMFWCPLRHVSMFWCPLRHVSMFWCSVRRVNTFLMPTPSCRYVSNVQWCRFSLWLLAPRPRQVFIINVIMIKTCVCCFLHCFVYVAVTRGLSAEFLLYIIEAGIFCSSRGRYRKTSSTITPPHIVVLRRRIVRQHILHCTLPL